MKFKLNNLYRFTWEDHYKGDWNGFAREFKQVKSFKSQEEGDAYYNNMIVSNRCLGILDYDDAYDIALATQDEKIIEDYVLKNTYYYEN